MYTRQLGFHQHTDRVMLQPQQSGIIQYAVYISMWGSFHLLLIIASIEADEPEKDIFPHLKSFSFLMRLLIKDTIIACSRNRMFMVF